MASGFPGRTPTPRLLLREGLKPNTLLPSKFQTEKFLTTKKEASTGGSILPRIGPCIDRSETRQKLLPAPPKQSVFGVSPPELVFQNFVAGEVSEMVLSIMNKDKISRMVKVCMESSPYFQLVCPSDVYHIVPPGASAPVRIRFTPDENKNYSHELTCLTAKEKIVVPIRATGARAELDFPAQLDFSKCPVKVGTQKTLLVRNVGNRPAQYQLSTQSPFSVVPTTGTLGAGDTVQVTVGFHPLAPGAHCGSLAVCCSSGEENIHMNLHGEAVEVNAGLSTNSVEFDKTFITMSSHTTLLIENRSDIRAHFQWKAFPTEEGEIEEKRRQRRFLRTRRELWLEKLMEEKEAGKEKGSGEDRAALLRLPGEMAKLHQDPMLFSDDIFFIEPMEGEIGPNCSAEIKVTFKPLEGLEYLSVAYCSISGCESRLPLRLSGKGQGPLIEFSSPRVDLGNISIDNSYVYEVELMNLGAIDAPFTYIPSAANVGFCFKFAPEQGIIAAGGSQTIQIFFSATVVGRFQEEFQFSVAGSPMSAILAVRGCVTGLSSHLDVNELDCGDISPGSTYTETSCLTDTSPVSRASLWGEAHSPNLQIQPSTLEFGCLVGGTEEEEHSLEMAKCSSLPVQCHGSICSNSQGNRLRDELSPLKFKPQPPKGKRTCLDSLAWRHFKIRNVEEPITALTESQDLAHSPGAEAFRILPLSGVLQPGESQQVSSPFSGRLSSTCSVPGLCHVEGGPSSEVLVPGEASGVSSSLSPQEINCGSQAPLRDRRELKQLAQKREDEAKALEKEERRKEEERAKEQKKGVSLGKKHPKPEKGKTKAPEKKEAHAPEKKETKTPKKETKAPEKKEKKVTEKKETKAPERDTKASERKETKASEKKEKKLPEKKNKLPEKKETKFPERKETKIPEKEARVPEKKETKALKKKEPKAPEKRQTKAPKKGEPKASKKGGTAIPEYPAEMEKNSLFIPTTHCTQFDRPRGQL